MLAGSKLRLKIEKEGGYPPSFSTYFVHKNFCLLLKPLPSDFSFSHPTVQQNYTIYLMDSVSVSP